MSATAAEEADYIAALKKALDTKAKAGTHNTPADAGLVEELVRDTSVTVHETPLSLYMYETPLPLHGIVEELARDTSVTVYETPLSLHDPMRRHSQGARGQCGAPLYDPVCQRLLALHDPTCERHLCPCTTGPGARGHRGAPPAQHRLAARSRGARRRRRPA